MKYNHLPKYGSCSYRYGAATGTSSANVEVFVIVSFLLVEVVFPRIPCSSMQTVYCPTPEKRFVFYVQLSSALQCLAAFNY